MRVAFVLPSLENKGPSIFTKYLIEALVPFTDYIEIFYFNEYPKENCIDISVPCTKIKFYKRYDFSNFDLVHSTMAKPDIFGSFWISSKKWVSSLHNFPIDQIMLRGKLKGGIINFLWKFALKRCNNIILSSQSMLKFYKQYLGYGKKYYVIPYGIPNCLYHDIPEELKLKGYNKSAVEKYLKFCENKERYFECKGTAKNSGKKQFRFQMRLDQRRQRSSLE